MTKLKLYTEEEIIRAIELSDGRSTDEVLAGLTSIELPSDEEIKEQPKYWGRLYKVGFVDGKKWFYQYLHDKILQGGNK